MEIFNYPERSLWGGILKRPPLDEQDLSEAVGQILREVKARGDEAMREYEERFDKVQLRDLHVSQPEMERAAELLPKELKEAIQAAMRNIEVFHAAQRRDVVQVQTMPGVLCWQKPVPVERVGLYVPGGTAPLFSTVLMLAVPARLAGCREIVLCTPPGKDGQVHPAILYAASLSGATHIYKVGGAQAIAALAYGTESIPKVDKIFGPGNRFVTAAKQMVSLRDVAIDMPAGPSEVMVLADGRANPAFVAADLLSQAEHGADSQSILVTDSKELLLKVQEEVCRQMEVLPRQSIAMQSLRHGKLILLRSMDEAMEMANAYAPEHLIIQAEDYASLAEHVVNAGSVFLGAFSPESAGDYASGTNHTLPTSGYAKAYSGVNLDSFMKKVTFQEITREGLRRLGSTIMVMAEHEHLDAHRKAVEVRISE